LARIPEFSAASRVRRVKGGYCESQGQKKEVKRWAEKRRKQEKEGKDRNGERPKRRKTEKSRKIVETNVRREKIRYI
jgi:hypothetical protein